MFLLSVFFIKRRWCTSNQWKVPTKQKNYWISEGLLYETVGKTI